MHPMIYSGKTLGDFPAGLPIFLRNRIYIYPEVKNLENKCCQTYVYCPKHSLLVYIEDGYDHGLGSGRKILTSLAKNSNFSILLVFSLHG